jgi:hypothetical protein
LLRRENTGSNTAADHITVAAAALAPAGSAGWSVLVRADSAGGTHEFLAWLHRGRLAHSVGFTLTGEHAELIAVMPKAAWIPAVDPDGQPRPGAWVGELTGLLDLSGYPPGMRVIVRKERPHPGAQLRITDPNGLRCTAFASITRRIVPLPDLELRHRRRARCEDRIRGAKDTSLTNLPLRDFAQKPDLVRHRHPRARADRLDPDARPHRPRGSAWEPKRLRHRRFSLAGWIAPPRATAGQPTPATEQPITTNRDRTWETVHCDQEGAHGEILRLAEL